MKNEKDEPKEYFERNIFLVICVAAIGLYLDWLSFYFLTTVNPWGAATGVPGLVLTLQALWLIVNPYAIVYEDRFEIKQSLFHHKQFYFLDLKSIIYKNNSKSLAIVYNDDEEETLNLFGIRASHKALLKKKIEEKITLSLVRRQPIIMN